MNGHAELVVLVVKAHTSRKRYLLKDLLFPGVLNCTAEGPRMQSTLLVYRSAFTANGLFLLLFMSSRFYLGLNLYKGKFHFCSDSLSQKPTLKQLCKDWVALKLLEVLVLRNWSRSCFHIPITASCLQREVALALLKLEHTETMLLFPSELLSLIGTSNMFSKDNHNSQIRNRVAVCFLWFFFNTAICTLQYLLLQFIICEDNENSPNATQFTRQPTWAGAVREKQHRGPN